MCHDVFQNVYKFKRQLTNLPSLTWQNYHVNLTTQYLGQYPFSSTEIYKKYIYITLRERKSSRKVNLFVKRINLISRHKREKMLCSICISPHYTTCTREYLQQRRITLFSLEKKHVTNKEKLGINNEKNVKNREKYAVNKCPL